jgi:putative tryptophan/tyrosine transport system substrate-binding protein
MRRREFIATLGGTAVWPLVARAQRPTPPVIGVLGSQSSTAAAANIAAFHRGLGEAGYVEGKNVTIEYRWADGQNDRLRSLAADLVRQQVAVIVTAGGTPPVLAAKAETATIPIVFSVGTDPVAFGLVASLNKPGGNLTGAASLFDEVAPKRMELLREVVPASMIFALLVNPANPNAETQSKVMQEAARKQGIQLHVLYASAERDIDAVFVRVVQLKAAALLIGGDPFLDSLGKQIAALAVRNRLPTTSFMRSFPLAGGLMRYGANLTPMFRLAGVYTGRILKGEKAGDLPVQQSTKIELVINLKTAKALGLEISPQLLARADEVIE